MLGRKNVATFILIVPLMILGLYIFSTYKTIKNSSQIYYHDDKILCVTYKKPTMSFGSGNKVLWLYTKKYIFLGKAIFGEHPLEIEKWEGDDILLRIENSYKGDKQYIEYVTSWVKRNTKIGRYNLQYRIIMKNQEIKQ